MNKNITKICPRCGSINIGVTESITLHDYCKDCNFNNLGDPGIINNMSNFPEIDIRDLKKIREEIKNRDKD